MTLHPLHRIRLYNYIMAHGVLCPRYEKRVTVGDRWLVVSEKFMPYLILSVGPKLDARGYAADCIQLKDAECRKYLAELITPDELAVLDLHDS